MTNEPPTLVVSNTDANRCRNSTSDELEYRLRAFAANLLHVMRGAGEPHDIVHQIGGLTPLIGAYYDAHEHHPFDPRPMLAWESEHGGRRRASDAIVRAALRLVAAHHPAHLVRRAFRSARPARDQTPPADMPRLVSEIVARREVRCPTVRM